MSTFIGRDHELRVLNRELGRPRPSLIIVYGRRRVGKSTLLLEATREKNHIYYQAQTLANSDSIDLFKKEIEAAFGSSSVLDSLSDWNGVLGYLRERAARDEEPLTIVLDEFPYLCESQPALPSIVQQWWDRVRNTSSPLNLILCGSKISFMESLLGERNPLHGRQTGELELPPLPYRGAARFFPDWAPESRLYAYGVFGGIPYYLSLCDPERPLSDNIVELILERGAPLYEEPMHILQAELTNVARYASVLHAIAAGCTEWGDIIGRVKEIKSGGGLGVYIKKLEALRLIRIDRSLDAADRARNRRYLLDDPFLAFWYRFVLPARSTLEAGHAGEVYKRKIAPMLDDYMGELFEWICRDYTRLYGADLFGIPHQEIGKIWGSDFDIDVAATLLDGSAFYGECKWWKNPVGSNILHKLIEDSRTSSYGSSADRHLYAIFARDGFTDDLEAKAEEHDDLELVTASALLKDVPA